MILKGQVHKYGANVDTDVIIPARYLNVSEPMELAKHCMEDIDPNFLKKMKRGDIIVADTNFGCGSSREHAPLAIKIGGHLLCYCQELCPHFLPQCHQYRSAASGEC